jgi:hypothetical protein
MTLEKKARVSFVEADDRPSDGSRSSRRNVEAVRRIEEKKIDRVSRLAKQAYRSRRTE